MLNVKNPKQHRSRESFDRVIDATIALLKEEGLAGLTVSAVSHRANVSVGSIYGRVDGKRALIREVQVRALQQLDQELGLVYGRIRVQELKLRKMVPQLVHEIGRFHRKHAALLNAFIEQSATDSVVERLGKKHHAQMIIEVKHLLLQCIGEIAHPDPEHAVSTCIMVIYGTLARYLGLGGAQDSAGEGHWDRLLDDLGLMTLAFLTVDLKQVEKRAKRRAGETSIA